MKSIRNLKRVPTVSPLLADDIVEFHAARLLLLIHICGRREKIDGLTKMAKLDFFVRYPKFFDEVSKHLGKDAKSSTEIVESQMIRFHYGPWDPRYYHILAYLKARGLVSYSNEGKKIVIALTDQGILLADKLLHENSFITVILQMKTVSQILGNMTGSQLKNLVYETFDKDVAQLDLGEVIK